MKRTAQSGGKRMKKSVLGIILCLCILAGLLPGNTIAAAATPTGGTWGGIDWSLDSDGTLTILLLQATADSLWMLTNSSPRLAVTQKVFSFWYHCTYYH